MFLVCLPFSFVLLNNCVYRIYVNTCLCVWRSEVDVCVCNICVITCLCVPVYGGQRSMSVCVIYVWVHVCVCACVWRPKVHVRCLQLLSVLRFGTHYLASLTDPGILALFPHPWVTNTYHYIQLPGACWEPKLGRSHLQQALYWPSHLPSPW